MAGNVPVEGRLVLTGAVTLQSAEAIHAQILEMAGQAVVEIDCSGATEVDLSLVQLILAARVSARNSGRTVTLAQPATGALLEALQRGGFLGAAMGQPNSDQAFWLQATGM
jgi:ABC-type transporter Mla MlaB component